MVQAARPVYCDARLVRGQFARCVKRGTGIEGAVLVEAVEDRAVVPDVVLQCALREFRSEDIEGRYSREGSVSVNGPCIYS